MNTKDSRWAVKWVSRNRANGLTEHFLRGNDCDVRLFPTRAIAKAFIKSTYGYIATRKDLRQEPHGWRMPQAVKVKVEVSAA